MATTARRVFAVAGGVLATGLVGALVVFAAYASVNLEELKASAPRLDGTTPRSPVDRAADGAVGFAREMSTPPPPAPGTAAFDFAADPPAGVSADPGHWCPRDVIGYRIDPTAALAAGSTLARERTRWRAAATAWTRASGGKYRFADRGTAVYPVQRGTTVSPVDPALVPAGEIAITYATGRRGPKGYVHPELRSALGVGGTAPVPWTSGPGQGLISRGMVVLDAEDAARDPHAVPTPYLHELGHALGLSHVTDARQMMHEQASVTQLAQGDQTGIRRLAALGCS